MRRQHVGVVLLSLVLVLSVLGAGTGTVAAQDSVEDDVQQVNELLQPINENINNVLNPQLENAQDVEPIDPVEAETREEAQTEADRIESEKERLNNTILDRIVEEINIQSNEIVGEDIAYEVDTPEEARQLADEIEEDWGSVPQAEQAYSGLRQAADELESGQSALLQAINILQGGETGTVTGTVVDQSGNAVEGITVSIEGGPSATTDSSGQFEFSAVSAGSHTLVAEGQEDVSQDIEVSDGEETDVGEISITAPEDDSGEDEDPTLLSEVVFDAGAVVAILTIVAGVAVGGLGAVTRSSDSGFSLGPVDMQNEDFVVTAKTIGFFVASGVAIGVATFIAVGWIMIAMAEVALPVDQMGQLVGLVSVFLIAPALAIRHGMVHGREELTSSLISRTVISVMVGTVLMVILGMLLVRQAGIDPPEVSNWIALGIAGLIALVSTIMAVIGLVAADRASE